MTPKLCPHCRHCFDACGREGALHGAPFSIVAPDSGEVLEACMAMYSFSPWILDVSAEVVAPVLKRQGYLRSIPLVMDTENALDLIRSVERL